MTEPIPGALGETAGVYKVSNFSEGMGRLAALFELHPELQWVKAVADPAGHVDITVDAGSGVLHNWVHALPAARREKGLFTLQSGPAFEELLLDGPITVHVRPKAGA